MKIVMHSQDFQSDLFGTPILPGLKQASGFVTKAQETELIEAINGTALAPFRFQQWTGKRLTHSYGWSYDFETGAFEPAEPIPDWLQSLKDRAATFAGLAPDQLVQALLIRYDPGAAIGWHRDRPVFEHVVGVSLGAPAHMRFRRRSADRFERVSAPLTTRGIYHMSGEARHDWEHSIAQMTAARWSVTFRSLAQPRIAR